MINTEFCQSINVITQLVAAQAERGASSALSTESIRVGQLMKMGPPPFNRVKVVEDPQGFLDNMEKIFWVMQATNVEGVNFAAYQLKDITYQWYE